MLGPHPRVFLSHSGKDKEFVKELYRRLTRDGVSCFFDIESIGWGENWVRALERAIDECEYIVFVLSPDFCNCEWAQVERTSSIAGDPSEWERKVRLLMRVPCRHLPTFPRFFRQVQTIDVSTNQLFEENYKKICVGLGGVPQEDASAMARDRLPPVQPLPELHRMPHLSLGDQFIGRVEEIWKLRDSLFRDNTAVLQGTSVVAGTGGLGKTQLAIEYAHRFGSGYTGGVYWVQADLGVVALITQISAAAGIDVNTKVEEAEQTAHIWRQLNSRSKPCLVILDNFPEDVALKPYLPTTGRVHTIVTTRRQDLGHAAVRLPILPVEDGVRLLNSGERKFGEAAAVLAERLGGLPLALELSKSYLNYRRELSVPELIEAMNAQGEMEVLAEFAEEYRDQLPSQHEVDIARTFQLSWDSAPAAAQEVLRVMGELSPAPVPRALLRSVLDWPAESALHDKLGKSLDELVRLSLVELDKGGEATAHRLILAFVRHRNSLDGASPFDRCVEVIQQQMDRAVEHPDAETNRELERLLPHAEFLAATGRLSPEDLGTLLGRIGIHHRNMGRHTAARQAHRRALTSAEESFAAGHPQVAIRQSNLALVLRDLGQLEEARDLLLQALASAENWFAPGHPRIAIRQSNLAVVLRDLGQFEDARDLLRQALASNEKSFAPGHPSLAITQSNLATVLRDLGQWEEARDLLRQALTSDEKSFAAGHPSIAITQSNLALVLSDLGQLEEARDLLRQALATFLERFGPEHPKTKTVRRNLELLSGA